MTNAVQINQHILYGYAKAAGFVGALFDLYRSATPVNPISSGNLITQTRMTESVTWDYMRGKKYGDPVFNACLDATDANAPLSCQVGDYLVPTPDVQSVNYTAGSIVLVDTGSGYAAEDLIMVSGGTPALYLIIIVLSVDINGAITSSAIYQPGSYSYPLPSNPIGQYYTTGNGIGATFNVTWSGAGPLEDDFIYYVQSLPFDMPPQVVQCNRTISIIRPAQSTGPGYKGYAGYTPATSTPLMAGMPASVLKDRKGENAPQKLPTDTFQPLWQVLIPNLGDVIVRVGDIIQDDLGEDYVVGLNELTQLGWRIYAQQVVNA